MRSFLGFALPVAAALSLPALAHAHSHSHDSGQEHEYSHAHGAHEHGVSRLDVVVDGKTLEMKLEGPAHNFVGFEHEPETDAERQAIAQAVKQLENGSALFSLTDAAGCTLSDTDIDAEHGGEHGHDHAHGYDHDHAKDDKHDAHRDYAAEYRFTCSQPQSLQQIDVGVFRAFAQTTEIRFQLAAPGGQSGGTLTPQDTVITLP